MLIWRGKKHTFRNGSSYSKSIFLGIFYWYFIFLLDFLGIYPQNCITRIYSNRLKSITFVLFIIIFFSCNKQWTFCNPFTYLFMQKRTHTMNIKTNNNNKMWEITVRITVYFGIVYIKYSDDQNERFSHAVDLNLNRLCVHIYKLCACYT